MAFFLNSQKQVRSSFSRKNFYDDPKNKVNGEFDVVTLDKFGYIFYEVKFRKKRISKSIIDEEIEQVRHSGISRNQYTHFY